MEEKLERQQLSELTMPVTVRTVPDAGIAKLTQTRNSLRRCTVFLALCSFFLALILGFQTALATVFVMTPNVITMVIVAAAFCLVGALAFNRESQKHDRLITAADQGEDIAGILGLHDSIPLVTDSHSKDDVCVTARNLHLSKLQFSTMQFTILLPAMFIIPIGLLVLFEWLVLGKTPDSNILTYSTLYTLFGAFQVHQYLKQRNSIKSGRGIASVVMLGADGAKGAGTVIFCGSKFSLDPATADWMPLLSWTEPREINATIYFDRKTNQPTVVAIGSKVIQVAGSPVLMPPPRIQKH